MNRSVRSILALAIGLLGVVWSLAIWVLSGRFLFLCAGGLLCGLAAVALSILYLLVFWRSPGREATETSALSLWFTAVYAAAELVSNTVFILRGWGGRSSVLLLGFGAATAVYLVLLLLVQKNVQRLSHQSDLLEQKLAGPLYLSSKLGELLSVAGEGEVRTQLQKLKEAMDYSSNQTSRATAESERQMAQQLDELMELLTNGGEPAAIQAKLRQAETTWKTRSSAASSMR